MTPKRLGSGFAPQDLFNTVTEAMQRHRQGARPWADMHINNDLTLHFS